MLHVKINHSSHQNRIDFNIHLNLLVELKGFGPTLICRFLLQYLTFNQAYLKSLNRIFIPLPIGSCIMHGVFNDMQIKIHVAYKSMIVRKTIQLLKY